MASGKEVGWSDEEGMNDQETGEVRGSERQDRSRKRVGRCWASVSRWQIARARCQDSIREIQIAAGSGSSRSERGYKLVA